MNKQELEKEILKLNKEIESLNKQNVLLQTQQKKYVELAQQKGSDLAKYTQMVLILKNELKKLDSLNKIR